MKKELPVKIFSNYFKGGHVQGIALDKEEGYIYYSFTTQLVKTDLHGNFIGSVKNILGHLGCITFDPDRRKVYGSLELKHDSIGKGIMKVTGKEIAEEDAFYLVSFDADAIVREEMDAETEGVMTAVWLPEPLKYYKAVDPVSSKEHQYGVSGIDGVGYGPKFSLEDGKNTILIAAGIYGDVDRTDNDCQMFFSYSPDIFDKYAKPLTQLNPHHSGIEADNIYFLYTGNTTWGVQNLEYDPFTKSWIVAVYKGNKSNYANYSTFFIDGTVAPVQRNIPGREGEKGNMLTLKKIGETVDGVIYGAHFPYGSTGVASIGDGRYYFSEDTVDRSNSTYATTVVMHKIDETSPLVFKEI